MLLDFSVYIGFNKGTGNFVTSFLVLIVAVFPLTTGLFEDLAVADCGVSGTHPQCR